MARFVGQLVADVGAFCGSASNGVPPEADLIERHSTGRPADLIEPHSTGRPADLSEPHSTGYATGDHIFPTSNKIPIITNTTPAPLWI